MFDRLTPDRIQFIVIIDGVEGPVLDFVSMLKIWIEVFRILVLKSAKDNNELNLGHIYKE